jgi:hypothetical protein
MTAMADLKDFAPTPADKARFFGAIAIEGVWLAAAVGVYLLTENLTVLIVMIGVSSVAMTGFILWTARKMQQAKKPGGGSRMVE